MKSISTDLVILIASYLRCNDIKSMRHVLRLVMPVIYNGVVVLNENAFRVFKFTRITLHKRIMRIRNCNNLRALNVGRNTNFTHIQLSVLTDLLELTCGINTNFTDRSLGKLTNLTYLDYGSKGLSCCLNLYGLL